MYKKLLILFLAPLLFIGCASVPMESAERTEQVKQFLAPPNNSAGLYIYRDSAVGTALKKDVWVDGICVGQTAPDTFFYLLVEGNREHTIHTESEFSANAIKLVTESGKNYFIEQYIKLGVFVGGAGVEVVNPEEAKKDIMSLGLALQGTCSN